MEQSTILFKNGVLAIGIEKADKLRDLALKLNKTGLTVNDCAKGLRTLMIFKKYGIKEDDDQETAY